MQIAKYKYNIDNTQENWRAEYKDGLVPPAMAMDLQPLLPQMLFKTILYQIEFTPPGPKCQL